MYVEPGISIAGHVVTSLQLLIAGALLLCVAAILMGYRRDLKATLRQSGVTDRLAEDLGRIASALERLDLAGLMCIPPFLENAEKVRPYFAELREMKEQLEGRLGRTFPVVSMGMSHDFEVAIEEGATEVRIGTALFGVRETP